MFALGDRVKYKGVTFPYLYNEVGTIVNIDPDNSDTVTVEFDSMLGLYSKLQSVNLELLAGLPRTGLSAWLPMSPLPFVEFEQPQSEYNRERRGTAKCDCGGFKTFNSMSPENHSSWCSSTKVLTNDDIASSIKTINDLYTIKGTF
jgi:hypothetical protein